MSEQERQWERLEAILGTSWDIYELLGVTEDGDNKKDKDGKPKPIEIPRRIRLPLLPAAAPEIFKATIDSYKDKYRAVMAAMRESGGGRVVELGTLSAEQARDLYKNIGRAVAAATPVDNDLPKD